MANERTTLTVSRKTRDKLETLRERGMEAGFLAKNLDEINHWRMATTEQLLAFCIRAGMATFNAPVVKPDADYTHKPLKDDAENIPTGIIEADGTPETN